MNWREIRNTLDRFSEKQQIIFLERLIPRVRGEVLHSVLLALANLYKVKKEFKKASELYELLGFRDEAEKALAKFIESS